jgi:hypothetical protein
MTSKARGLANLGNAFDDGALSSRNKVINGAMVIDQRNAGAAVTAAAGSTYSTVDRWRTEVNGGGAFTVQRSTTAPVGFSNSLLVTVTTADASIAATDFYDAQQFIEGFNVADLDWGTANAKPVTISFWVRSSLTGTFAGSVGNGAANRSYVFTYSISAANTWEYKTVTVEGDTTGTWLKDNGRGLVLSFDLGNGSDYQAAAGSWVAQYAVGTSSSVKTIATNEATFYITGVQLEAGDTATPFEHRSFGQELALCQRYYEQDNTNRTCLFSGNVTSGGAYYASVSFKVEKRASPTVVLTNDSAVAFATTAGSVVASTEGFIEARTATSTARGVFQTDWTAAAEL